MTLLVADVGGTNTRIALIREGAGLSDLERYRNDDFSSFSKVLTRYGEARDLSGLAESCIAVAGPVASGRARLTNRDWSFDQATIATALPPLTTGSVHVINDLVALGFALPGLKPDQLTLIRPSSEGGPVNNQSLVAGVGTGFNICVVRSTPDGPVVIEAELGHACLPANVSKALAEVLGDEAAQFVTYEHLFSGRGLSRLYRLLSGGKEYAGSRVVAGYDPGQRDAFAQTVEMTARMLGVAARELVFQYLPFGGIHFAGGAARGVLGSAAKGVFLEALTAPGPFSDHIAQVPIKVIVDDAAALTGAVRYTRMMA